MPAGLSNTVEGPLADDADPANAVPRLTALSSRNWNAAASAPRGMARPHAAVMTKRAILDAANASSPCLFAFDSAA